MERIVRNMMPKVGLSLTMMHPIGASGSNVDAEPNVERSASPDFASCVAAGGNDHVCEPNSLTGNSGGCSTAPGAPETPGAAILAAWLLALSLLFSSRRRRFSR